MNGSDGARSVGAAAAAAPVIALGVTIVQSGNDSAGPPPANAGVTGAVFDPAKLTVHTTHWWPLGGWSAKEGIQIRSKDVAATKKAADTAYGRLASGDGRQVTVRLEENTTDGSRVNSNVRVERVDGAGEYSGALSLDPLTENAASLELTLKARHGWIWPFLVLVAGVLVGVFGPRLYEAYRRRSVLQLSLIEAGRDLLALPARADLYPLHRSLLGSEPYADLTPSRRHCKPEPTPEVPKLWCNLHGFGNIWLPDKLDAPEQEVAEVARRVGVWKRAGEAAAQLKHELDYLPSGATQQVRTESQALLDYIRANEPTETDAETTIAHLSGQAAVVMAFTQTWKVFEAVGSPPELDPGNVYRTQGPSRGRPSSHVSSCFA